MDIEYLNDTDTLIWKLDVYDYPYIEEIRQEGAYILWEQRDVFLN